MTDPQLEQFYTAALGARHTSTRESCVAPDALLDLVERRQSEATRLATLDHVMTCAACRSEFELLRSIAMAGRELQRETRGVLRILPRPLARRWAMAAAAVAVLASTAIAVGVWTNTPANVVRGAGATVQLVEPIHGATVAGPPTVRWHATPDATRYDLEVLDPGGEVVFSTTTSDTTLVVDAALDPSLLYRWWVRARLPDGSERRSRFESFRLHSP